MLNLIKTEDGSNSLLNSELDETYHSRHGAIQESAYVFIKSGLHFWLKSNPTEVAILEIGFGTGLNALLTLQDSLNRKIKFNYSTIEAFPVESALVEKLNYPELLQFESADILFQELHKARWNFPVAITSSFILEKREGRIQEMKFPWAYFDIIYFDAFAPNKQPEMWDKPVLEKIVAAMRESAVFVTYCAKGQLKRDLKSLGLKVETLPGPPGKREMVRAQK